MEYLISFLEGIITFISPCLLPMLPIYILYFAAGQTDKKNRTLINAIGFVLGFTVVFVTLGVFASSLGHILHEYQLIVNIMTGCIVIIFGLNFIGILKIGFLNRTININRKIKPFVFFSAVLFGVVFSISWTPCVGAFLGSALMLASQQGSVVKGAVLLLLYSVGLGIPFILSAVLIEKLTGAFEFIKKHYKIIRIVCGVLLILTGILMATGLTNSIFHKIGGLL